MLKDLFGPSTVTAMLRGGLEEASSTHRAIAERVAGALSSSSSTDFSAELGKQAAGRVTEADLQHDMSELADIQIRYEADAQLLRAAYQRIRSAVHERNA